MRPYQPAESLGAEEVKETILRQIDIEEETRK